MRVSSVLALVVAATPLFIVWDVVAEPFGSSLSKRFIVKLLQSSIPNTQIQTTDDSAAIVKQVQALEQIVLGTVHAEKIVPVEQTTNTIFGKVTNSRLIYFAKGSSQLGIDLRELTSERVINTADKVTVTLPPVKVLGSTLDVKESEVFSKENSIWFPPITDKDLQTEAQRIALEKIQATACADPSTIQSIEQQAVVTIGRLLQLGNTKAVEIKPASTSCLTPTTP